MNTFLAILSALGGLSFLATLLSIPWAIGKLKADTNQATTTAKVVETDLALRSLLESLRAAESRVVYLSNELNRVQEILRTERETHERILRDERAQALRERELHEERVFQLMNQIRERDSKIIDLMDRIQKKGVV